VGSEVDAPEVEVRGHELQESGGVDAAAFRAAGRDFEPQFGGDGGPGASLAVAGDESFAWGGSFEEGEADCGGIFDMDEIDQFGAVADEAAAYPLGGAALRAMQAGEGEDDGAFAAEGFFGADTFLGQIERAVLIETAEFGCEVAGGACENDESAAGGEDAAAEGEGRGFGDGGKGPDHGACRGQAIPSLGTCEVEEKKSVAAAA
jgi:hypothetical protein